MPSTRAGYGSPSRVNQGATFATRSRGFRLNKIFDSEDSGNAGEWGYPLQSYLDMYEFEKARKLGTSFKPKAQAQHDGKQNGIAIQAMQYGRENILQRTGVLYANEDNVIPFGDSNDIELGQFVYAIGNPLGFDYYGTITSGIVSGLATYAQINTCGLDYGVCVTVQVGGAAANAGLQDDDVIIGYKNALDTEFIEINNFNDLREAILNSSVGEVIIIRYVRDGEVIESIPTELGKHPDDN